MKNLKVKIITGYRKDQEYTIDAEEAHKAYYLFLNPEERGVFENGVAIRGKDIQSIRPDYHATMGWNPQYRMTADDMNTVRREGAARGLRDRLATAKRIAGTGDGKVIALPLSEAEDKVAGLIEN